MLAAVKTGRSVLPIFFLSSRRSIRLLRLPSCWCILAFTRNPLSVGVDDCSLQHQTLQKHQGFRVFSDFCHAVHRQVRLDKDQCAQKFSWLYQGYFGCQQETRNTYGSLTLRCPNQHADLVSTSQYRIMISCTGTPLSSSQPPAMIRSASSFTSRKYLSVGRSPVSLRRMSW